MSATSTRLFAPLALLLVLLTRSIVPAIAQEPAQAEKEDTESNQRLERMRTLVQQFSARPRGPEDVEDLALHEKPILRYNDGARGLIDASVWRLGASGRSKALVTVELYTRQDRQMASYEFLAVDPPQFRGRFRRFTWEPQEGAASFRPVPDAPAPADNERTRLTQMKQLARRFNAHQTYEGMNSVLRLMPQPIDRYQPAGSDGAAFAFASGVNPEVLLLIEADGPIWKFACARMSTARLVVELDGEAVWEMNPTGAAEFQNSAEPYTQSLHYLPVAASNGN
jgi:hypothetical protein